jgi:hypothetical protein
MARIIKAINHGNVTLQDSGLKRRRMENRKYLMELESDKLLLHHRFETGFDFGQQE